MLSLIVRPVWCSCSSVTRLALGFFPTHSIPILIPTPPQNIPDSPFLLTPFSFRFGNLCINKKATQHNSHRTAPVHAADQLTLSGTSLLRVKTLLLFSTRYTRPKRNDEKKPTTNQNFLAHSILESYTRSLLLTNKQKKRIIVIITNKSLQTICCRGQG